MKITRISEALGKIDDEISREAVEQFEQKSIHTNDVPAQAPRVLYEHKTRKAPILIAAAGICAAAAIAVPVVNHFRTANLIVDSTGAAASKVVDYSAEESDSKITPELIETESVKVFKEYFEKEKLNQIYGDLSDFVKPLNMTETKNGVTITLHEMFKCNDWVILSMSCDVEETDFTQPVHFIPVTKNNCYLSSSIEIDGKSFIGLHLNDYEVSGNSAHIDFDRVYCYDNNGDQIDSVRIARNAQKEDTIGFDIPADFNKIAPTVVTDIKDFAGNDELTFKRISVSPYHCDIEFDGVYNIGRYGQTGFRFLMKDGTYLNGSNFWADTSNMRSIYFREVIDPNELAAVEIDYYIGRKGEKIDYERQEPLPNDIHAVIDVSTGKLIDRPTAAETDGMSDKTEAMTADIKKLKVSKNDGEFVVEENASDANVNLVTVQIDRSKSNFFAIIVNKDGSYKTYTDAGLRDKIEEVTEKYNSVAYIWSFQDDGWREEIIGTESNDWMRFGHLVGEDNGDIIISRFWFSLNSDINDYVSGEVASSLIIDDNDDGTYSAVLNYGEDDRKTVMFIPN